MREIKFRAWDEEAREMVDWDIIVDDGFSKYLGAELMQYTGLKDKNGKEIYEGDVCWFGERGNGGWCGKIDWDEDSMGWTPWVQNREGFDMVDDFSCEVIGNIYENPELVA